uniref:MYND-type domain-containing protein n=1 Tax=Ficedula albicollis TaxID=59894 RepID=A0A803WAQ0_FICAL
MGPGLLSPWCAPAAPHPPTVLGSSQHGGLQQPLTHRPGTSPAPEQPCSPSPTGLVLLLPQNSPAAPQQRSRGRPRRSQRRGLRTWTRWAFRPWTATCRGDVDSLGFQAMDRNVPGLSHVILQKLNMKSYEDYKSAMDGRKSGSDFGIRTYFDMFQKMEDTFKFCVECKKLPDALPDPKSLRRCKRCQNVYYCGVACQRANWPLHKKFCKKLKLVALDRLVEWLVFTGGTCGM